MSTVWKGSTAIQLQRVESRWTSQRGWEAVYTYIGEKTLIASAATNSAYVQYATSVDVVPDKNLSELRVTFASADNSQPDQYTEESSIWTFEPLLAEKNIEENPKYVALGDISGEAGFTQRILEAVKTYNEKVATGISAQSSDKDLVFSLGDYITYDNATNANISTTNEALAAELAGLLVRGHTTYRTGKYMLQNVKVVPPNTSLVADHYKTGYQWSTARIIDQINAGTPSVTFSSIIGNLVDTFPNDRWLKEPPTISSTNNGKFEIITRWEQQGQYETPYQLHPYY